MKGYHKVGRALCFKGRNIAANKVQSFAAKLFCDFIAIFYNVGLKVDSVHFDTSAPKLCQKIVYGKGQIAFAAAQVADCKSAVFWKIVIHIREQLDKAVYLTVFCLFFVKHPSFFVANAERRKKLGMLVAVNYLFLFSVVLGDFDVFGVFFYIILQGYLPFFRDKQDTFAV